MAQSSEVEICSKMLCLGVELSDQIKNEERKLVEVLLGTDDASSKIRKLKVLFLEFKLSQSSSNSELAKLPNVFSQDNMNTMFEASSSVEGRRKLEFLTNMIKTTCDPFLAHKKKLEDIANCLRSDDLPDDQTLDKIGNILL